MDIQRNLTEWIKCLKGWQTELAYRILTKSIEDEDISDIISMLKSNDKFDDKPFPSIVTQDNEKHLKLLSIGSVNDIEGLAPRNPLAFNKDINLSVIYGANGSGKSGYTKIIKKISGKPRTKDLHPNVFTPNPNGKCNIKYIIEEIEHEKEWEINSSQISDLEAIDVFDASTGKSYIEEANVSTYTPSFVSLFNTMSHYITIIQEKLKLEQSELKKCTPVIPNEYSLSEAAKIYNEINKDDTIEKLDNILAWDNTKENKRLSLDKILIEKDPAISAEEKHKQKIEIDKIIEEIKIALSLINSESEKEIRLLKENALNMRKKAQESACVIKESELDGVGSKTWKSLWEAARDYSINEAYKNATYPNMEDGARCVLCHQKLNDDAQKRLLSFENYIKSHFENEASKAEKLYNEKISLLPISKTKEILSTKCNAAHLNEKWLDCLTIIWEKIENISDYIKQGKDVTINFRNIYYNISILKRISERYDNEALEFEKHANRFDRVKVTKELLELNTNKWCSKQKVHIIEEIERLKQYDNLVKCIAQCNTTSITKKASEISEIVITEEYVRRFNSELKVLNADKIKVELIKDKATKGKVTHSLKLCGINDYKPCDILSEGEHRIIALASFIADVTGGNSNTPFVFDDPISSLDQKYEEKVVDRLIELSKSRQVIVFTHRLSLLGLLCDKSESDKIQIIAIRKESWGAGEIGNTDLYAKRTDKALNTIKNDILPRVKKIFKDDTYDMYYPYGKQLCSDIRIIVERIVETNLLNDVVQRYRRVINTLGKVDKLYKITKEDCDIIYRYMTKYSKYEHSQPNETPIEVLEPEEIEKDIDYLSTWLKEFNNRLKD